MLCKHNPNKRCTGNFAHKYWVGDKLLAKCEGEIQVEMVDGTTGERVTEDMSSIRLEVCCCVLLCMYCVCVITCWLRNVEVCQWWGEAPLQLWPA